MSTFASLCRLGALWSAAFVLAAATHRAHAGAPASATVTLISSDAQTTLSLANTYTHLLDFVADGSAATINGIQFTAAPRTGANYTSTNIPGEIPETLFNGGGAGTGADPGSGLHKLLMDFYYNSNANGAGQAETITLSGLTPGLPHRLRMFYRQWDANEANTRFTNITFTHDSSTGFIRVNQDESENARMMTYDYTPGPSGTLNISFQEGGNTPAASWHQYGLANEALIPEPATLGLLTLLALPLLPRRRPPVSIS